MTRAMDVQAGAGENFRLTPRMRLRHARQYQRVYDGKARASRGPITAAAAPNGLTFWRLGIAVGRGVGNAVERHRVKRMLREAFRLGQHDLPRRADGGGYDVVLGARAHKAMELRAYIDAVLELARGLDRQWARREAKANAPGAGDGT
ncbi:MAG: ribonuclease P protein component [Planctomycetota bacterium]|nr:ribonuclease P protein component [Planctomycetota bacterium]